MTDAELLAIRANVERWRADLGVCAAEYVRDVGALLALHDAAAAVINEIKCRLESAKEQIDTGHKR